MQSTLFVFGLVVLAAVLVKQGNARSLELRDLLLGELKKDIREKLDSLLGRELESDEEQSSGTQDRRSPGSSPESERVNRNNQDRSNDRRVIGNGDNSGGGSSNSNIERGAHHSDTLDRRYPDLFKQGFKQGFKQNQQHGNNKRLAWAGYELDASSGNSATKKEVNHSGTLDRRYPPNRSKLNRQYQHYGNGRREVGDTSSASSDDNIWK